MGENACTWEGEGAAGPLGIDYIKAYHCRFYESGLMFFPILLGWSCYLIYLLGHTADGYFSPTLATLSDKLKLTYDVAGVTFLALGNGAPDVFSSIAAFSSTDPSVVLVGVCELLGGAIFVTTVVVGAVSILHPAQVRPQAFVRDILFQVMALLLLTISALYGRVTIGLSFVYLGFYALYVMVVLYLDRAQKRKGHGAALNIGGEEHDSSGVMSAFWFTPSDIDEFHRATETASVYKLTHDFLLLDDDEISSSDEDEEDDGNEEECGNGGFGNGGDGRNSFAHDLISEYFPDPIKDGVIDGRSLLNNGRRSGGGGGGGGGGRRSYKSSRHQLSPPRGPAFTSFNTATSAEGAYDIADDHLSRTSSSSSMARGEMGGVGSSSIHHVGSSSASLGGAAAGAAGGGAKTMHTGRRHASVWDNMYWQQWRWRRRLMREFHSSDFLEKPLPVQFLTIIEYPIVLLRNVTIPLVEEDSWSRINASLCPIFGPLFLMYVTGSIKSTFGDSKFRVWVLVEIIGAMVAVAVSLTTHEHRPPRSYTYSMALTAVGFSMCAAWIYTVASELVAVIDTLGELWEIPVSLLGLTMMAWGNSAGDLITNIAVARAGLSDMAVAGCFAGPTFNLLVGLGLSFLWKSLSSGSFTLEFDQRAYICLTFLYIGLGTSLGMAYFSGFRLGRKLALPLLSLYIFSSLLQIILMVSGAIK